MAVERRAHRPRQFGRESRFRRAAHVQHQQTLVGRVAPRHTHQELDALGFPSWAALKQDIEDRARSHADRVRLFLEKRRSAT